jgi:regulator of CtrA degradation
MRLTDCIWDRSMSNPFGVIPPLRSVTIPFRPKAGNREQFMALFREGMALVEETANYLDGEGRRESKMLKPFVSLAYATESMRLTTRLTQLATWLLTRRAELNGEEAAHSGSDNAALLLPILRNGSSKGYEELPEQLRKLIDASFRLHEKIYRIEAAHSAGQSGSPAAVSRANPVANQVAQIAAAFTRR